jgi:hypothetical protein
MMGLVAYKKRKREGEREGGRTPPHEDTKRR